MNPHSSRITTQNSLALFSEKLLDTYGSRVAADWMDGLFYMTVGSGRLRIINQLTESISKFLRIGDAKRIPSGCYMEAVLGEFGSGKSHIGYMLKHNALTCGEEVIVAHCQITGESRFTAMIAAILRSLRVAGVGSLVKSRMELSAYIKLAEWIGGSPEFFTETMHKHRGNIPTEAILEFQDAICALTGPVPDGAPMQSFISRWVAAADPKTALEIMNQVFRMFGLVRANRILLIIDEFEALSALSREEQLETLQFLQDFHDDYSVRLPDSPAVHIVLLSTDAWWKTATGLLPSLFGEGDRTRRIQAIPNITQFELVGLMERYITLMMMTMPWAKEINYEDFNKAVDEAWKRLAGKTHHMRTVHAVAREAAEFLCQ